jgi:hypothetical protein
MASTKWGRAPDVGRGSVAYNGGMTSTDTESPTQRASVADIFLGHLAGGEFDQLATIFEPDVSLSALLPDGLHEWHGPERVIAAFVGWFGRVDEYELLNNSAGNIGPRLQLQWRARVRGGVFGEASFVVEQHLYADAGPTGRIQTMSMLCSGFAREHRDV